MELNTWLDGTELIVCVGSGGVGKTTTAASIGLWAALRGRKVMVLTIDPAKRLANSLGLTAFGNEERQIDLSRLPEAEGELWAMMLDSKSTWDNVIARVSPDEAVRDRILNNHVFRIMADTFAGSQEYMATEKLYDIVQSGKYDLVVLDTPPVKNALDFLESPGRVVNFLDEKVLGWFLQPYDRKSIFSRITSGTSAVFFRLLGAIFGQDFLDDLTELMRDLSTLYAGFRERHDAVVALFRSQSTSFVTVCAPTESSVDVGRFFAEELSSRNLPRGGLIVNQVHKLDAEHHDASTVLDDAVAEVRGELDDATVRRLMARLGAAHRRLFELAEAEELLIEKVRASSKGGGFYQEIPRLDHDVHDLIALREVGRNLFDRPASKL